VSGLTFAGIARRWLLLVALVAALAGCGGAAGPLQALSADELADAASTSAAASSGGFELSMEMVFPGRDAPFAVSGSGVYDTEADRTQLSLDLSGIEGFLGGALGDAGGTFDVGALDAIKDGADVYVRGPVLTGELPEGKSWVRFDAADFATDAGMGALSLAGSDPRTLLELVRTASGEVETVGREDQRGVSTTHYRATLDPQKYERLVPPADREELLSLLGGLFGPSGLGEVPFDVWIDDEGYVRKAELALSDPQLGTTDEEVETTVSLELYDYGEPVAIAVPPADEVVDSSALPG